jgi:hypothetical protein
VTPPPRSKGDLISPRLARPVPFCRNNLRLLPLISLRRLTEAVPERCHNILDLRLFGFISLIGLICLIGNIGCLIVFAGGGKPHHPQPIEPIKQIKPIEPIQLI